MYGWIIIEPFTTDVAEFSSTMYLFWPTVCNRVLQQMEKPLVSHFVSLVKRVLTSLCFIHLGSCALKVNKNRPLVLATFTPFKNNHRKNNWPFNASLNIFTHDDYFIKEEKGRVKGRGTRQVERLQDESI